MKKKEIQAIKKRNEGKTEMKWIKKLEERREKDS